MLHRLLLSAASLAIAAGIARAQDAPAARAAIATDPEVVRVMSFNVRYHNRHDGENRWEFRRHRVSGLLRLHRADIFGVQEAMSAQVEYLQQELPHHDAFGAGRDGRAGGERCSLFWDRRKFTRVDGATFWLSPTPERPSAAWGASLRRICTWCRFESKATGLPLFVFNTHFDHRSENARRRSAALLVDQVAAIAGDAPVVLIGDLNCDAFSVPYRTLVAGGDADGADRARGLRDAREWAEHDYGPTGTWSGWDPAHIGARIDFVLVKNAVRVLQHAVVPHQWNGRVASDHLPVLAELALHDMREPTARNLAHLWRLQPDPDEHGEQRGWHTAEHDDSGWPTVFAGEAWERQGHALDGVVWLRRRVFVPESWRDDRVQFVTGGIADVATVFVNGTEVARLGSEADSVWAQRIHLHLAASTLRFGGDNTIALRIDDVGGLGGLVGLPLALTTDDLQPTHSAVQFERRPLIERRDFQIPKDTREVTFDVTAPDDVDGPLWLCIGIGHDRDGSGDRGVHYRLLDAAGKVVHRGSTAAEHVVRFEHRATAGSRWRLVVSDEDTADAGRLPGNGCSLEVQYKVERPR